MKKLLVLGLILLAAGVVVSCKKAKQEPTSEPVSPLSPLGKPASDSPLGTPPGQSPRFPGKIAFHSDRTGLLQIYVLDGETGQTDQLTAGSVQAFEPGWSPDCQSLTYAFGDATGEGFEVYTMRADGSEQTRLFEHPSVDDWSPAWSPRGDMIAYQTNEGGSLNVCFSDLNGESKGCLLQDAYSNALPAWSSDGERVLFISNRDGGDWDVFVTEVGSDADSVQLTKNDVHDSSPQFSPDGRFVTYASERLGNFDVYVADADGSNEIQLTFDGAEDVNPRWVGDDQIVFASIRTLDWELYLMKSDGSAVTRLTSEIGLDKWPVWCSSR